MKLVTYDTGAGPRSGAVLGELIVDLHSASDGSLPVGMLELLATEGAVLRARRLLASAAGMGETLPAASCVHTDRATVLAPLPRPGKVICLGINYRDHAAESGLPVPAEPVVFSKAPTSVIGPGAAIVLPEASEQVDYEVELAFVIGRRAKLVKARQAMDYVAGYTVLNDVSARDYQREKPGGQWHLAKSFDTFCPIGPWILTADEIADPHNLALSCAVSGELMQSSNTSQMIFRIPEVVEYLSRVFTLEPGDVVGTGTPAGVGFVRTPPRYLRRGDVVGCTIQEIGTLENPVR